jgi:peptide/nickel transport system permease protein
MKKFKPNILHFLVLLWCLTLLFRFTYLLDLFHFTFLFIIEIINNFPQSLEEITLPVADVLFSLFLFILFPIMLPILKKRFSILSSKLSFTKVVLLTLTTFVILSPIAAPFNPDYQQQISLTRLLPPLSNVKVLFLKETNDEKTNYEELKTRGVKRSFDNTMIYIDSIQINESIVTCFQKNKQTKINIELINLINNNPKVGSHLFLLGTDEFGRDIFSRLIYGTRISLFIGFCSVFISLTLGLYLGFVAGYFGGITDSVISRFTDMFLAFPVIFLLLLLLALFGNSLLSIILILGFSGWMSLFKIVRSEVITVKKKDFVATAGLLGFSRKYILIKEILPLIMSSVIVNLIFQFGNVILAEASLSYLGLGTGLLYPSWGSMIESGQNYINNAWWMIFFPGFFLFITLYSANSLGRALRFHYNPERG